MKQSIASRLVRIWPMPLVRRVVATAQRAVVVGSASAARKRLERIAQEPKVFVVSFHKCGTRSTIAYLKDLGLSGIHWPTFGTCGLDYVSWLRPHWNDPDRCVELLVPLLEKYDCFGDVPFSGLAEPLGRRFPNSKFILLTRSPEDWWDSLVRHWELDQRERALDSLEAVQYRVPSGTRVNLEWRDKLVRQYVAHEETCRREFEPTGRLLVARLGDEGVPAQIAAFVGRSDQAAEFPRIRKGG